MWTLPNTSISDPVRVPWWKGRYSQSNYERKELESLKLRKVAVGHR